MSSHDDSVMDHLSRCRASAACCLRWRPSSLAVRQSLYAFAGFVALTMTAPSAVARNITCETEDVPTAPSYDGAEGPSPPQGGPQAEFALLAVSPATVAADSDENVTELQLSADDWGAVVGGGAGE